MTETKIISEETISIKVYTTEDGRKLIDLNNLNLFMPKVQKDVLKSQAEDKLVGFLQSLISNYPNLILASTSEYYGVYYRKEGAIAKETLFYTHLSKNHYASIYLKNTLNHKDLVRTKNDVYYVPFELRNRFWTDLLDKYNINGKELFITGMTNSIALPAHIKSRDGETILYKKFLMDQIEKGTIYEYYAPKKYRDTIILKAKSQSDYEAIMNSLFYYRVSNYLKEKDEEKTKVSK